MRGGRTAVLDLGRLLQFGPTIDVYHRPNSVRVAEIFSDPPINVLPAQLDQGQCRLSSDTSFAVPAHMTRLAAGEYRVGVRANHVSVQAKSAGNAAVPVDIELAEISGSGTFFHGPPGRFAMVPLIRGVPDYSLGERAQPYLDPA